MFQHFSIWQIFWLTDYSVKKTIANRINFFLVNNKNRSVSCSFLKRSIITFHRNWQQADSSGRPVTDSYDAELVSVHAPATTTATAAAALHQPALWILLPLSAAQRCPRVPVPRHTYVPCKLASDLLQYLYMCTYK